MPQSGLTRDDSAQIGFIVSSIFATAIDQAELQAWADHILATTDSCPLYLIELSTFDDQLFRIYDAIGFHPHSGLTKTEDHALTGIALLRGRDLFEKRPTPEQALAALAANPQILARFRETFPFIDVPPMPS